MNQLIKFGIYGITSLAFISCGVSKMEGKNKQKNGNQYNGEMLKINFSANQNIDSVKVANLPVSLDINCPDTNYKNDKIELKLDESSSNNTIELPAKSKCDITINRFIHGENTYQIPKADKSGYIIKSSVGTDQKVNLTFPGEKMFIANEDDKDKKSSSIYLAATQIKVNDVPFIKIFISKFAGIASASISDADTSLYTLSTNHPKEVDITELDFKLVRRFLNRDIQYKLVLNKDKLNDKRWSENCKFVKNTKDSIIISENSNIDAIKKAYDGGTNCSNLNDIINTENNWNVNIDNEYFFIFASELQEGQKIPRFTVIPIQSRNEIEIEYLEKDLNTNESVIKGIPDRLKKYTDPCDIKANIAILKIDLNKVDEFITRFENFKILEKSKNFEKYKNLQAKFESLKSEKNKLKSEVNQVEEAFKTKVCN